MEPQTFSTRRVNDAERIDAWEAHHARALLGLACAGPRSGAFEATVRSVRVGPYGLAHVVATPHAVRRTREHIGDPAPAGRVIYLTRRGDARLVDAAGVLRHGPGSAIVCAADQPFEREFRGGVDELVVTFGGDTAERLLPGGPVPRGRIPGAVAGTSRLLVASVHRVIRERLVAPEGTVDDLTERLRMLFAPDLAAAPEGRRTLVLDFVDEHLHEPGLSAGSIASRLDLSDRTLRRLFAAADRSLAEEIRTRRLRRARQMLGSTAAIGDIAAACGFASHEHFSRLFRAEYGFAPRDARPARSI